MISPACGQRISFYVNTATRPIIVNDRVLSVIDPDKPLDAGIVYVWSDRMVNLDVADHYGRHHSFTSVTLLQDGDPIPQSGWYATWMPYQKGQAAKAEALETAFKA